MKITCNEHLAAYAADLKHDRPDLKEKVEKVMAQPIPFWHKRELLRFLDGTYTRVRFDDDECQEVWDNADILRDLFVHQSCKDPSLVAFTSNDDNGMRDIQTQSKIGRFLAAHSILGSVTINQLGNGYRQTQLNKGMTISLTTDPTHIYDIYRSMSTGSCMSHPVGHWGFKGKFFVPTKDWVVQERIDQFRRKIPLGRQVSPVAWYALAPELALAYYEINGNAVARAVVNTKSMNYARVYGNEFMAALLKKEGYQKTEALGSFRSAVLIGHNSKVTESVLFCPYVDGDYSMVKLDLDKGLLVCDPADNELDPPAPILGTMRGYDMAGITLGQIYNRIEDIVNNKCTDCGVFMNRQQFALYRDEGHLICTSCFSKLLEDEDYVVGTFIKGDNTDSAPFSFTLARKDEFIDIPNIRYLLTHTNPSTAINALDKWALSRIRTQFGEALYEQIIENSRLVHKASAAKLRTDPITMAVTVPWLLRKVLTPSGDVVDTLATIIVVSGSAATSLTAKYGTHNILRDCWEDYDGELKITPFGTAFFLATDFRTVYHPQLKTLVSAPRGECIYATRTRNWYYASGLSRNYMEYLPDEEDNPKTLVEEHGIEVMSAFLIIANYLPFAYTVPLDVVDLWKEELAATKRNVIAATPYVTDGAQE